MTQMTQPRTIKFHVRRPESAGERAKPSTETSTSIDFNSTMTSRGAAKKISTEKGRQLGAVNFAGDRYKNLLL
jgi:hypothetical protein